MVKEKDPVDILLSEAFPETRESLGPCEITWHATNKQMTFVFMADQVALLLEAEVRTLHFDLALLKQVVSELTATKEEAIEFSAPTVVMLECRFQNPDYGAQIARRFTKRLIKNWGPQQVVLVPNYGQAKVKDSILFWRAIPCIVTRRQVMFHILPTEQGESVRRGM